MAALYNKQYRIYKVSKLKINLTTRPPNSEAVRRYISLKVLGIVYPIAQNNLVLRS